LLKGWAPFLVAAVAWMPSEDVVRDVAEILGEEANITWFTIEAEHVESIHNHSAYVWLERTNHKGGMV
jgi:GTP cyclohydrolase FolE2